MKPVSFLLDEDVPVPVAKALRSSGIDLFVLHSGHEPNTPASGTLDPDVLIFAEEHSYALVSFDKTTMPDHIADHLAAGRHTWGVFISPPGGLHES